MRIILVATIAMLVSLSFNAFSAESLSVKAKFKVNAQEKQICDGYRIGDVDYFKLLDLASILNASAKQFNVEWSSSANLIKITPQKAYSPISPNILVNGTENGVTKLIFKDYKIMIRTYVADSDVYVNLRDLMQWLDVGVEYNISKDQIALNTKEYLLPKAVSNPFKGSAEAIDNKYIKDYGKSPGTIHQEIHRGYYDGMYYIAYQDIIKGYKPIVNQNATSSVKGLGDYDASNLQFYNGKIYFETSLGSAATHQDIWCSNLNGTGLTQIIKNTIESNGQSMTLYKGKIYVCTYASNNCGKSTVKRYSLNGIFEADIVSDEMVGRNPFRRYSFRSYSIFDDKIYYINKDYRLFSVNLDGTNKTALATLATNDRVTHLVCAYDNYIYYITSQGLFRRNIDGKEPICIVEERDKKGFSMENISIYGDKIAYPERYGRFGIVNTDGTGRTALPNAMYDVANAETVRSNQVSILNADYTLYKENELLNNDPQKEGYVKVWAYGGGDKNNTTAWMPSSAPYIYNTQYKQGELSDGTYYIKAAKAPNYSLGISAASKENQAKLILWEHSSKDNRKFIVKSTGTGCYTITPKHSGKQLSSNEKIGMNVYQGGAPRWECKKFEIVKENSTYRIKDSQNNYFGIAGGKMTNGTEIVIWSKSDGGSQEFIFEKID